MARWKWLIIDLAALLALWHLASTLVPHATTVLPPIDDIAKELYALIANGELLGHVAASVRRTLYGFGLAVTTGVPIGILIGSNKSLQKVTEPLIEVTRPISPIAWIPLSILWFGIGEESKIF